MATNYDSEKHYVVGIGEALFDIFKNEDKEELGGAPLIFAYHAAQSHCKGVIVSAIGTKENGEVDEVGKRILDELDKLHLSKEYIFEIKNKPSGTVDVDNSNLEDPSYTLRTDVAWANIPYDEKLDELAKQTKAVYFGVLASYVPGTSKDTIDRFLDSVPDDCLKIFDVNMRQSLYSEEMISKYLNKCNVLKVNNKELEDLCMMLNINGGDVEKCYSILNRFSNILILIVTMGRYGSSVYWHPQPNDDNKDDKKEDKNDDKKEIAYSSLGMPVELKNTVGAGDALAGAFIGELLRGKTHVAAHHFAARRAVMVCEAEKSMPPITQNDIFISYSWKDESIVAGVFCKMFESWGFSIWRDKNKTRNGDDFNELIKQAIKNSGIVVFFSSRDANISPYVEQEIKYAKDNKIPIIPIKLDNSLYYGELSSMLNTIDYLDLNRFISSIEKHIYGHDRNKDKGYVIGIGELLFDCYPNNHHMMGGAPANFAYHASQFGYNTLVVSAIGNDKLGKELRKELQKHNLNAYIEETVLPTGTVNVDISDENDPQYTINTEVAWSVIPFTDKLAIIAKDCCAVCFGTLAQYGPETRKTIGLLLDAVPKTCYKVYDVNLRKSKGKALYTSETVITSLSKCNILKVNADELDYLSRLFKLDEKTDIESKAKELFDRFTNIKILIVTLGADGSWVFKVNEAPSFEKTTTDITVVDTVGAGDAFTGAFIGSILDGKSIKEAHQTAVKVAAFVCTQAGAMPDYSLLVP